MKALALLAIALVVAIPAAARDRLVTLDTRPGVSVAVYLMKREGAKAAVVLLPGGSGGLGLRAGVPDSNNFVVRARDLFTAQGLHVAVVSRPGGMSDMDYAFRTSAEHVQDLKQVTALVKKEFGVPVWFVGTSRGTVSATAAAIAFGNTELAGIVLTSSVTGQVRRQGARAARDESYAVPNQKLDAIRIPVLVVHHSSDACKMCVPSEVPRIERGLANSPVKRTLMVDGGANPDGDPCEALHWHGFIGMEKEVVALIAGWIRNFR